MSAGADSGRPAAGDLSHLHVVLPVRQLEGGKQRLGEALDPEERAALTVGMLRHELAVLAAWPAAEVVHVVSPDPAILRIAEEAGARPLAQLEGGLDEAVLAARGVAVAAGATALLVLPGDLPLLDHEALEVIHQAADAALAAGRGRALVVVAPADAGDGTNALLLAPPDIVAPAYGPGSLERHLRAAGAAGASVQLVTEPALGFDLDLPGDLERLDPARLAALEALGWAAVGA